MNKPISKDLFNQAIDFEAQSSLMIAKSEHRAWNVAKAASVLVVLLIITLMLLMPLKGVTPYLVKVNAATGYTELLSILNNDALPQDVALDKFWIANYVRYREHYDWYSLQHDYNNTLLLSSSQVAMQYAAQFEGDDALDTKWGKRITASIDILSIIAKPSEGIATVRFTKSIEHVENTRPTAPNTWIATITYKYQPDIPLSMQDRLKNPLGFNVTSYRVDAELTQ